MSYNNYSRSDKKEDFREHIAPTASSLTADTVSSSKSPKRKNGFMKRVKQALTPVPEPPLSGPSCMETRAKAGPQGRMVWSKPGL
ncbi:hypothetical protein TRVA0_002S03796 [Trichomonascus vanleenenianus]|uniref:uncharacterized protein n=1 Tax=Trichomonascus vanleenenianus TaxID=2268995 RepID=UPI003EC9AC43